MRRLLKSGRIKEPRPPFYIVNYFTVAKNIHEKPRLILDLWHTIFVYKVNEVGSLENYERFCGQRMFFFINSIWVKATIRLTLTIITKILRLLLENWPQSYLLYVHCSTQQFKFCSIYFYQGYALSCKKFGERKGSKICLYIDDSVGPLPIPPH